MSGVALNFLAGGVGLFLLGMFLMTDGLKMAAGPALGKVLTTSTETRLRGLFSGMLVTALVQSSSAVTVAAIGFVNAGLLTFSQSLWVLFGANVGTTMTGWLVALIGFRVNIEGAALPMIGIGMALRLSGPDLRRGAAGSALAGFGVLFLGLGFLQQAFPDAGSGFGPAMFAGSGAQSVLLFVLAGLLLTIVLQSSSVSLAIVLTLADAGAVPLTAAAAAVIGANVGTTVTALLAVIGATPNAKRAAFAHVLFNVLTAVVALLVLPFLLGVVSALREGIGLDATPAVNLALFHTTFNVLGVALMWPFSGYLARFLEGRFHTRAEQIGRPLYIDRNVASVPSLAVDALRREINRVGGMAVGGVWSRVGTLIGDAARPDESAGLPALNRAIADFVTRVSRGTMSASTAQVLANLLRVQHYYENCGELASEVVAVRDAVADLGATPLHDAIISLAGLVDTLLVQLNPDNEPFAPLGAAQVADFESGYQEVKAALLSAGARGEITIDTMEQLLRSFSALHRVMDQAAKAARLLEQLRGEYLEALA
ncbi:MAG: Na/Pi symporter [Azonexus sp.]|jgi:phosphate:Na+ symporter